MKKNKDLYADYDLYMANAEEFKDYNYQYNKYFN